MVFSRVKPKLAVYYHFVLLGTPTIPPITENDVIEMTRKTYDGPLLIGEDLMAFRIDPTSRAAATEVALRSGGRSTASAARWRASPRRRLSWRREHRRHASPNAAADAIP